MTVRDIFELRKQGRIEEAYEAIRPMYAAHKGKYTSICMFWTASDIFKLRLEQGRTDEATQILQALKRMLPYVEDKEGKAIAFIQYATRRLSSNTQKKLKKVVISQGESQGIASDEISVLKEEDSCVPRKECVCKSEDEALSDEDLASHLVVGLDEGINRSCEGVISTRQRVFDYIKNHEGCSVPKITIALTIPAKSVERHVASLIVNGLIEHRGSKKTGGYYPI